MSRRELAGLARQTLAVARLEAARRLFSRRALPLLLLAALPVVVPLGLALLPGVERGPNPGWVVQVYPGVFAFVLGVTYFGCVWVFTHLFRGEILDRTLHYYLLAPLNREVLVAGKYLAGLATTALPFGGAAVAAFLCLYLPFGTRAAREHLLAGPGGGQLVTYLGIAVLACVGYGAVFLLAGMVMRNPIVPAAVVLGWEGIHFLLPPALKKLSVVHYLKALLPVPATGGPFALVSEPPAAWVSVTGLVAMAAALLAVAGWRARRLELRYGED